MKAFRRAATYLRHGVPELFFPSSLPDPPHIAAQVAARRKWERELTLKKRLQASSCLKGAERVEQTAALPCP